MTAAEKLDMHTQYVILLSLFCKFRFYFVNKLKITKFLEQKIDKETKNLINVRTALHA